MSASAAASEPRQARSSNTSTPSGSQTIVQSINSNELPSATLRLRGVAPTARRRIQWAEDVVDNEGMGKKSSKVCCIYHKPHEPDDSDSSSSSGDDSDEEPDLSRARKAGDGSNKRRSGKGHKHGQDMDSISQGGRAPSPNAYERQPKHGKSSTG